MEEMSIVYIKVPIDLICLFTDVRFNIDFVESMVELAEYSGLDEDAIWSSEIEYNSIVERSGYCLLYTSPSPRDKRQSRMPSSA